MVLGCYFLSIKCSYLRAFLVGFSTPKTGFQIKTPRACPQASGNRPMYPTHRGKACSKGRLFENVPRTSTNTELFSATLLVFCLCGGHAILAAHRPQLSPSSLFQARAGVPAAGSCNRCILFVCTKVRRNASFKISSRPGRSISQGHVLKAYACWARQWGEGACCKSAQSKTKKGPSASNATRAHHPWRRWMGAYAGCTAIAPMSSIDLRRHAHHLWKAVFLLQHWQRNWGRQDWPPPWHMKAKRILIWSKKKWNWLYKDECIYKYNTHYILRLFGCFGAFVDKWDSPTWLEQ